MACQRWCQPRIIWLPYSVTACCSACENHFLPPDPKPERTQHRLLEGEPYMRREGGRRINRKIRWPWERVWEGILGSEPSTLYSGAHVSMPQECCICILNLNRKQTCLWLWSLLLRKPCGECVAPSSIPLTKHPQSKRRLLYSRCCRKSGCISCRKLGVNFSLCMQKTCTEAPFGKDVWTVLCKYLIWIFDCLLSLFLSLSFPNTLATHRYWLAQEYQTRSRDRGTSRYRFPQRCDQYTHLNKHPPYPSVYTHAGNKQPHIFTFQKQNMSW
jgi:hypothetical protein